jgi:putative peptide zinc metalloprotease protein
VLLVVPLLAGTLVLMVLAFPRVAGTAWDSVGDQWARLGTSFGEGDVLDMVVRLLSIVAIALPVLGMVYVVSRLVRQVSTKVWRSTEDRPVRRGAAIVVALAIVAGLGWAWWPEEDRYRPIQSYERGSLVDALPMAAPSGLDTGAVARASTSWPSTEPLPTPDRPALSVVLVPRESPTSDPATSGVVAGEAVEAVEAGTWVFPFNRPPAPGEGDNQALAVNTQDGATVYDVAFALVWADDETTDNVNSAYALASCRDCTTVAVAFQVVLVVGESAVVPQNLAAAVNYSCIECVTGALAQQLVLTLDGPPDAATLGELEALWKRIAAYGETLRGRSLREIRAQLSRFEAEIASVLGVTAEQTKRATSTDSASPSGSASPSSDTSPSGSPSASASGSPSGDPSTAPSADADVSATPSGTSSPTTARATGTAGTGEPSSASGSATATTSPTPQPSTSPSPTATATPTATSSP